MRRDGAPSLSRSASTRRSVRRRHQERDPTPYIRSAPDPPAVDTPAHAASPPRGRAESWRAAWRRRGPRRGRRPSLLPPHDPAHHQADNGGAPVGIYLQVRECQVAEDAGIHLHALYKGGYSLGLYAARSHRVREGAQNGVGDALTRDGRHGRGLELVQDGELGAWRQVVWGIDDLVCVAHKGVEGVYAGPELGGEQSGREIVGPTVDLLYLAAQLVALGERETAVELLAAIRVQLQEPPTSRPMRSATSLAPMVTSGTPVPGLVLAPTKYIPCTAFDTIGGRKYPT